MKKTKTKKYFNLEIFIDDSSTILLHIEPRHLNSVDMRQVISCLEEVKLELIDQLKGERTEL